MAYGKSEAIFVGNVDKCTTIARRDGSVGYALNIYCHTGSKDKRFKYNHFDIYISEKQYETFKDILLPKTAVTIFAYLGTSTKEGAKSYNFTASEIYVTQKAEGSILDDRAIEELSQNENEPDIPF